MLLFNLQMKSVLVLLVAGSMALGMTLGVKPAFADNDKHEKHKGRDQDRDRQSAAPGVRIDVNVRIGEPDRVVIHDYYRTESRSGHCPPGLAKKNNGCMPPGQAKKWRQGERLPREVVFHELPSRLAVKLTVPPPGYRYVRVANDILMIAIGSGLVVDALQDLGSM
jgi:Ni/Co efflux regulator RcnB